MMMLMIVMVIGERSCITCSKTDDWRISS